jgi:O-antigen/teichoic acid export membrane protein
VEGFVRTFSAGGIMGALFPYIAKHQDDKIFLKSVYEKYLHIISFVAAGLSALLFITARDVFTILFTDRWLYAADLFRLMMLAGIVWPASSLMVSMISGVGNSKNYLRLEVYKKLVLLPAYIFGFIWGLNGFIISFVTASFLCLLLNMNFVKKEINTGLLQQIKIMMLYIAIAIVGAIISWTVVHFSNISSPFLRTAIYSICFAAVYLAGAFKLKLKGTEIIGRVWVSVKKLPLFADKKN